MRRTLPAPPRHNHDPWHPCAHPVLHRLALRVVLGGWLVWAVLYGWRWGVIPSQLFAPDKQLLMWWVFGGVWFCLVIPVGVAFLYTMTVGKCGGAFLEPPPSPPNHNPWHPCNYPTAHRLSITLVLGGWLYWALVYGVRWAVMQHEAFDLLWRPLLYVVFGLGWIVLAIPGVTVVLYLLMLGRCLQAFPASYLPRPHLPVPGRRTTERIIFSPDAAEKRFGIRGTIIVERDREED